MRESESGCLLVEIVVGDTLRDLEGGKVLNSLIGYAVVVILGD